MGLCTTLRLHAPTAGELGASLVALDRRLRKALGPLAWGCEELRLAWGSEEPAEAGDVVETGAKVELITKVLSMSQSEAEVLRDLQQVVGIAALVSVWQPGWVVALDDDLHFVESGFGLAEGSPLVLQGGVPRGTAPEATAPEATTPEATAAAHERLLAAVGSHPAVRRALSAALAVPGAPAPAAPAPSLVPSPAPAPSATPSPAPASWSWEAEPGAVLPDSTAAPLRISLDRGAADGDGDARAKARVELVGPPRPAWRVRLEVVGLDAAGQPLGLLDDHELRLDSRETRDFRATGTLSQRPGHELAALELWVTEGARTELPLTAQHLRHGPVDEDGDGWVVAWLRFDNPGPAAGELCVELTFLDRDGDPVGFERSFHPQPVPPGPGLVHLQEFVSARHRDGQAAVPVQARVFRIDSRRTAIGRLERDTGWRPAAAPAPPPVPAPTPAEPKDTENIDQQATPNELPPPPDAWALLDAGELDAARALLTAGPLSYPDQSKLRRLFSDRDTAKLVFALEVATATDFRSAASSLRRLLSHDSADVRLAAVRAAGALAGPSMTVPVRRRLEDPSEDPAIQQAAAEALEALG
jgi:hypothetical protein